MLQLPMARPGPRAESAPGGPVPGSPGESPGSGEAAVAASAFLPLLMQVLIAPPSQVACPAPNREESAPVPGGGIGSRVEPTLMFTGGTPLPPGPAGDGAPGAVPPAAGGPAPDLTAPRRETRGPEAPEGPSVPLPTHREEPDSRPIPVRVSLPDLRTGRAPDETGERSDAREKPASATTSRGPEEPAGKGMPAAFSLPPRSRFTPAQTENGEASRLIARLVSARSGPLASSGDTGVESRTAGEYARAKVMNAKEPEVPSVRQPREAAPREPVAPPERLRPDQRAAAPAGASDESAESAPGPVRGPSTQQSAEKPTNDDAGPSAARGEEGTPAVGAGGGGGGEETPGPPKQAPNNVFPLQLHSRLGDILKARMAGQAPAVQGLPRELVSSVLDRVVRELIITGAHGATEARLTLKPDSLGQLLIHISMDDNLMSAKIEVTEPSAKVVLDAGMPQLRDALASRGISVHQIDVTTSPDTMAGNARDRREGKQKGSPFPRMETPVAAGVFTPRMLGYNTIELSM